MEAVVGRSRPVTRAVRVSHRCQRSISSRSFLGLGHIFTANMTGNAAFKGFAAAGAPELSFTRSVLAPLAFLSGAVIVGRFAIAAGTKPASRWPAGPFGIGRRQN